MLLNMGTPEEQRARHTRWKKRDEEYVAAQALIPNPDQSEEQLFEQVRTLYEAHKALHPDGHWLLMKKSWGPFSYASEYGRNNDGVSVWCRIWITGQMAGKLLYTPDAVSDEEKADTDWLLSRERCEVF